MSKVPSRANPSHPCRKAASIMDDEMDVEIIEDHVERWAIRAGLMGDPRLVTTAEHAIQRQCA